MKTLEQFQSVPQDGIIIRQEGAVLRLFFDIEPVQVPEDGDGEAAQGWPDDLYECYNVDVNAPVNYGSIIAAIVNDRYSADDVQALQANYIEAMDEGSGLSESKRTEYIAEWKAFQAWRARAKEIASVVMDALQD